MQRAVALSILLYAQVLGAQSWRLFTPDPNAAPAGPPRNDKHPTVPRIGCGPGTNVIFCD